MFLSHGQGGRVWDADGNEYVDLVCGLLPVILGYCDPDVDAAIRDQLGRGISFSLATTLEAELAERLVDIIPCAEKVRFGKNGSDATSAAVRLARAYTGRDHIAACGYHGWQDWYIGATTRNKGVPAVVGGWAREATSLQLDVADIEGREAGDHRVRSMAGILSGNGAPDDAIVARQSR
jgi:glutamate-1-semialdehyde 2,1-aminomutase/spore coat polysaccharide biosynthesis protein SpsF